MTRHFDRYTDKPVEISSLSLAMVEVDFWCLRGLEIIKHARWIQLYLSMTDHKKGIGISSIFDTVFRYWPILLTVLLYWLPPPPTPHPQCPPHFVWKRFSWITQQICLPDGFQQKQVQDNKLDWKNSLEHKLTLFTNVGENCVLITYNGNISFNFIDIAAWVIVT